MLLIFANLVSVILEKKFQFPANPVWNGITFTVLALLSSQRLKTGFVDDVISHANNSYIIIIVGQSYIIN